MSARVQASEARESFLGWVGDVRPELHRYCARLTGSVIDAEDLVQETLARAFFALGTVSEVPEARPWLFRIAHHAAVDLLKSHGRSRTELHEDVGATIDRLDLDTPADPAVVRAALARFLVLPLSQRSAVILKDVLGLSLEETAETMGTTVMAVKALLVRGRAGLRELADEQRVFEVGGRAQLDRYASRFNARDWEGLRAMISDDCALDLVSKARRRGAAVGQYFDRYANEQVTVRPVRLEGRAALAAFVGGATTPAWFILLTFDGDRLVGIRDFRYVPYLAAEAVYDELPVSGGGDE